MGKIKKQMNVTHIIDPFKSIQMKGFLHLPPTKNREFTCDENRLIGPILLPCKKNKSIKLELDSKIEIKPTHKNKYQMADIHQLVNNVASLFQKTPLRIFFHKI